LSFSSGILLETLRHGADSDLFTKKRPCSDRTGSAILSFVNGSELSNSPPEVLLFPDRKQQGRFPVRDGAARVVAQIATSWTGMSFAAIDSTGEQLCAGSTRGLGLSGRWRATNSAGAWLLSVTKGFSRSAAELTLARGGVFVLRGSARRRDFAVTDVEARTVLAAAPLTSAWSLHPYDFAIEQGRDFNLAEIVALVQIWRMLRNSEDAAAGVAVAAGG
jgi:hypothetical protein